MEQKCKRQNNEKKISVVLEYTRLYTIKMIINSYFFDREWQNSEISRE